MRSTLMFALAALLAVGTACGGSTETSPAGDQVTPVRVDATIVKKMAMAARQIKKSPEDAAAVLEKIGMDEATFEATLYQISMSSKAAAQYAEAFARPAKSDGGGKKKKAEATEAEGAEAVEPAAEDEAPE